MPAPWLPGLGAQLRNVFTQAASREHLEPRDVRVFWTPRRLVLCAEVRSRQEDRKEEVWGPSLKIAKDGEGNWTKAAEGFARKNGVSVEALATAAKAAGGETHLLHVRQVRGAPAAEILKDTILQTLRSLSFPKRMSWDAWLDDGKGSFPFGRPIRWLVALLDGVVVPVSIYGMTE